MQFLLKDLKVACPYFIMFVAGFFCLQTCFAEASSISKNYNELISKGGSQSGTCLLSGVEGSKKTPAVYGVYGSKVGGSAGDKGILCVPIDNSSLNSNTPDPKNTAIKSEIQSLLDRIKALNDQIKGGGTTPGSANPLRKNDIREVPKTCTVPTKTLSMGSKGSDVEQLQNVLSKTGHFKGDSTGYFGEQTREAVRSFQKSQGLVSSGDERSTGFGMVGEKTRGMFKKHCEDTPKARTYGLSDVASVTYTTLTLPGAQNVQLSYEVTLKDGTKRHFVSHDSATTPVNPTTEKVIKNTGYTGVIAELLAKAVEAPKQAATNFRLKDVKTVTTTSVDPSTSIADDEYTEYTVTLKDARTITIKGHAGRGTEEVRYKPFRDAGYKGNVEVLLKTATPKVLGATTSSAQVLLGEVEERLEELKKLF